METRFKKILLKNQIAMFLIILLIASNGLFMFSLSNKQYLSWQTILIFIVFFLMLFFLLDVIDNNIKNYQKAIKYMKVSQENNK